MPQTEFYKNSEWSISYFLGLDKRLDLTPEIQRRSVWPPWRKLKLIDSIARGLPIGAITIFKNGNKYEVIDGKQRLESILSYLRDEFEQQEYIPNTKDMDEATDVNEQLIAPFYNKKWKDVDKSHQYRILDYQIPVILLSGNRSTAVQVFGRMNTGVMPLNDQEIRNAVFRTSEFLHCAKAIADDFTTHCKKNPELITHSGFLELGIFSPANLKRMQDIETSSQLLIYAITGQPQEARRTISNFYKSHNKKSGPAAADRKKGAAAVKRALKRVWNLTEDQKLKRLRAWPNPQEEQLYALVAALIELKWTDKNFNDNIEEIRDELKYFWMTVQIYHNDPTSKLGHGPESKKYFETFEGQKNSADHRRTRIEILQQLLSPLSPSASKEKFSERQKAFVWAASDEKCARCKELGVSATLQKVKFEDYHCGHILADGNGGKAILSNAQVEHKKCNEAAQDREDLVA